MKAIIMAGGMGTRLRPLIGEKPKPMVELMGKPIMEHIIIRLKDCGFDDICVAVKYRAEDIMDYFGDGSSLDVRMQYRIEREALGTAGSVKNCADFYGDEDFLVISGDAACDFDLSELMDAHRAHGPAVSIALYKSREPLQYGLALTDMNGQIKRFIEKPAWPRVVTDCVNTGIYVISPRAMNFVPSDRSFDFGHELFPLLLEKGEKLMGFQMQGYWCDIGTPEAFYRCGLDACMGRLKLKLPENFTPAQPPESEQEQEESDAHALFACTDRAGLMGVFSRELMDMGADYSDGLRLCGRGFELSIRPAADISALRLAVKCPDAEFARSLIDSAMEAARAVDKGL